MRLFVGGLFVILRPKIHSQKIYSRGALLFFDLNGRRDLLNYSNPLDSKICVMLERSRLFDSISCLKVVYLDGLSQARSVYYLFLIK